MKDPKNHNKIPLYYFLIQILEKNDQAKKSLTDHLEDLFKSMDFDSNKTIEYTEFMMILNSIDKNKRLK